MVLSLINLQNTSNFLMLSFRSLLSLNLNLAYNQQKSSLNNIHKQSIYLDRSLHITLSSSNSTNYPIHLYLSI